MKRYLAFAVLVAHPKLFPGRMTGLKHSRVLGYVRANEQVVYTQNQRKTVVDTQEAVT